LPRKHIALIITLVGALVFCLTLYRALFYAASDEIPLPSGITANGNENSDIYPTLLNIPSIDVNAEVVDVGITSRGNMGTPTNYDDVGWYRYGILPGEEGSAVMAGHVDNGLSLAGVFAKLSEVKIGDDIFTTNKTGKKFHFIVSDIATFDFDAKDTNVFTQNDGKYLKLITCVGTWIEQNKTHDKRLVVTASLAE
jgi:sortase A